MISRRQFLVTTGAALACGFATPAYARLIEPRWLRRSVRPVTLPGRSLPHQVRLLHLSDFHLSPVVPLDFIGEAVEMGLAEHPDLICLTGDFVTGRLQDPDAYRTVLGRLASAAPTFASLGNHDGGAWTKYRGGYPDTTAIRALLADSGITCLYNEARVVTAGDAQLLLIGLGDEWAVEFEPERAFAHAAGDEERAVIVLSHNPDTKEALRPYAWDLLLCGHTHGGQFYLPFIGAPFAPVRDHRFVDGLHAWEGRQMHITRGVGNIGGLRFNCRPEISLLELHSG